MRVGQPIHLGPVDARFELQSQSLQWLPILLTALFAGTLAVLAFFMPTQSYVVATRDIVNRIVLSPGFATEPREISTNISSAPLIPVTKDIECLQQTIYHESRGESWDGQVAVAHVVMNRVRSRRWPNTVCGVVTDHYQFEWYDDHLPNVMTNQRLADQALAIANAVASGTLDDPTQGATCYVRNDIRRLWMRNLDRMTIGRHTFLYC